MKSIALETLVKMMKRLPASISERAVEHMPEYLADLEDEALWDEQFARSQSQLVAAAEKARQEAGAGKAGPMEFKRS